MDHSIAEEFATFRTRILPRANKTVVFLCGSFYEQPLAYAMLNLTDLDNMYVQHTIVAVLEPATIPKDFHGEILTIETRKCHKGFARLLRNRKGKTEYYNRSGNYIQRPAITRSLFTSLSLNDIMSAASKCKPHLKAFNGLTTDIVYAVSCPFWPPEAAEWMKRKRYNGWPTRETIETVVAGGCHLVPKSHQSNPNDDTTWRFSFSQAELLLVNSWNEVQKYVYHILRLLKADVIAKCGGEKKTFLCTYYFKTLMLWACEEKPSDFWSEDRVEASVEELLLQMIEWLIERKCPNYFMRENNMFDYFPSDTDVSNEVSLLHAALQNISSVIALEPKVERCEMFQIRLNDKLLLIGQLALNRRVFINLLNGKLNRFFVKDLPSSGLFAREVEHLFRAVQLHRLMMSDLTSSDAEISETRRKTYECEALEYFQSSYTRKRNYKQFDISISLLDSIPCAVGKYFETSPFEQSQRGTDEGNFTRDVMEVFCQSIVSAVDESHQDPSYFINAGYYANFCYTGLRDYRQALKVCDEALASFKAMEHGISFDTFELGFSIEILCVFINCQYVRIYDAGIQVVLGFLTLCMHTVRQNAMRGSCQRLSDLELIVQVSPLAFLAYIGLKCRTMLHLNEGDDSDYVNSFLYTDNSDYITILRMESNAALSAAIRVGNRRLHISFAL